MFRNVRPNPPGLRGSLRHGLLLFAACAVFVLLLAGAGRCAPLVLVTLVSPPLEYEADGQAAGMNVEVVREALRRMGREASIRFVPWKRALEMVRTGSAQGIIDAGYSAERAAYLNYPAENIYLEEIYAFKRTGDAFTLDEDLGNAAIFHIGAGRGFFYGARMDKALREGWFKDVTLVRNVDQGLRMLLAGHLDMLLGVRVPVVDELRRMGAAGSVDVVPMTETGEEYLLDFSPTYLAFSRAATPPGLADEAGEALRSMKVDGTYERIRSRYLDTK
jgi:polar amino acid transport system substrate-binding protein